MSELPAYVKNMIACILGILTGSLVAVLEDAYYRSRQHRGGKQ